MHYKKDGTLDMRYSSSRAAVSSGSGYASRSTAHSQPARPQTVFGFQSSPSGASSGGLHYKKDGSLDMRYSSSRSAMGVSAPSPAPAPVHMAMPVPSPATSATSLHYKKDGSLDMRYSSSKAAVGASPVSSTTSTTLHTKKDGSLDMRYASSRTAAASALPGHPQQLHFKKDGSLDMRFASSKAIASSAVSGKPSQGGLHYKKDGTLDMRYSSSKRVEMERQMGELLVSPGSGAASAGPSEEYHSAREAYYQALAEQNETYRRLVEQLADRAVPCTGTEVLPSSNTVAAYLKAHSLSTCEPVTPSTPSPASTAQAAEQAAAVDAARLESVTSALPSSIRQLTKAEVDTAIAGQEELGKGAFGLVYKGRLDDRDVAVKVLFVSQLQRNERGAFEKELIILGHLGTHVNLVQLHAYSLEKPAFVMELVALGSLHHNLYFNNDETVTATLGTSGTKKKILVGILSGIIQLHHVGIVHGDLKPHNVLLTEDYVAKITDFGLSRLRAKASSLTGSTQEATDTTAPIVAGTSAYMAPELLDGNVEASTKTDMYSLGVLFNELCVEEDPYSEHYRKFLGKGPYACTLFAKEGHRPRQTWQTTRGAKLCNELIGRCWHADPSQRPTAAALLEQVLAADCVVPSIAAATVEIGQHSS